MTSALAAATEPTPRRSAPAGRRVVVHDYAGHPFQVQLSRALARRGHEVLHLYCPSVPTGRGDLDRRSDDPSTLAIEPVPLDEDFARYQASKRLRQEIVYGGRAAERVRTFEPSVVLSANTPLLAQWRLLRSCRRAGIATVFWQQDVLGVGTRRVLARKVRFVGAAAGSLLVAVERASVRRSDGVVVISPDFTPTLQSWNVADDRIAVVPNWAPIDELPVVDRDNSWSREHGLDGRTVLLYSGTLGLKHNPDLLLQLARGLRDRPDVEIVVVSEGLGADWLDEQSGHAGLSNLRVLPYQPYDRLPEVLGSADVLLAVLEHDAGAFSVPSKVLTYLCAGRAILAAIPTANLAARLLREAGAGMVVDPLDGDAFLNAARRLVDDSSARAGHGAAARAYAEQTFDIDAIADRFATVLQRAVGATQEFET
jgi:glycosyltransferase involved in cell wall biosynthesis